MTHREQAQKALSERLPEYIFDRVHQDIGQATTCWTKLEKAGTFDAEHASKIAFNLCHFIADELERAGYRLPEQTDKREAVARMMFKQQFKSNLYSWETISEFMRDEFYQQADQICSLFSPPELLSDEEWDIVSRALSRKFSFNRISWLRHPERDECLLELAKETQYQIAQLDKEGK